MGVFSWKRVQIVRFYFFGKLVKLVDALFFNTPDPRSASYAWHIWSISVTLPNKHYDIPINTLPPTRYNILARSISSSLHGKCNQYDRKLSSKLWPNYSHVVSKCSFCADVRSSCELKQCCSCWLVCWELNHGQIIGHSERKR